MNSHKLGKITLTNLRKFKKCITLKLVYQISSIPTKKFLRICLAHKKDDRGNYKNYGDITLLFVAYKTDTSVEKVVFDRRRKKIYSSTVTKCGSHL